jgi:hypothetical protein
MLATERAFNHATSQVQRAQGAAASFAGVAGWQLGRVRARTACCGTPMEKSSRDG